MQIAAPSMLGDKVFKVAFLVSWLALNLCCLVIVYCLACCGAAFSGGHPGDSCGLYDQISKWTALFLFVQPITVPGGLLISGLLAGLSKLWTAQCARIGFSKFQTVGTAFCLLGTACALLCFQFFRESDLAAQLAIQSISKNWSEEEYVKHFDPRYVGNTVRPELPAIREALGAVEKIGPIVVTPEFMPFQAHGGIAASCECVVHCEKGPAVVSLILYKSGPDYELGLFKVQSSLIPNSN